MKNVILYAVIFIIAFIATTYGVYTYNEKYVNLFEFDLRDASVAAKAAKADSLALANSDSLVVSDNLNIDNKKVEKVKEVEKNLTEAKVKLDKTSNKLSEKEKELEMLKKQLEVKNVEEHEEWLKSTIKLYEAMETTKAGQLLKALPDDEARELIYSMKNKKAAEILSSLDTETIKRLTREKK